MALEWTEDSGPRALREVARRISEAPGQDSAYAHCLGCGRHVSGRVSGGFSARGTAEHVEGQARGHTAETGHTTRMYSPEPVIEFFIAPAA